MNKLTSFVLGIVTGAAVGTVVGFLYAPSEGRQTRRRLSYQFSRLQENLQDLVEKKQVVMNEAKNQGEEHTNTTKRRAKKIQDEMDKITQQMQEKKPRKNSTKNNTEKNQ